MTNIQATGLDLVTGQQRTYVTGDVLTVPTAGVMLIAGGIGPAGGGSGGGLTFNSGAPVTEGSGGPITMTAAASVGTDQPGAPVNITAGVATGVGSPGSVVVAGAIAAAAGLSAGGATITGGAASASGQTAGFAIVRGGTGFSGANGGSGTVRGGNAAGPGASNGGSISIIGGDAFDTDKNGGGITNTIGRSTGAGFAHWITRTALSGVSGSTLQTLGDRELLSGKRLAVTNNTTTTFVTMSVASNTMIACAVNYTSRANDATDFQVEDGWVTVTAVNKAGTITTDISAKYGNQQSVSAGTLTVTLSVTTGASLVNIQINNNSSLTTTTNDVAYQVKTNSQTTITPS